MSGPAVEIAAQVVRWQAGHGRNHLPWQNTRDAYRVWLSEIMLQQTRVEAVAPYFASFLAAWPTVGALAARMPVVLASRCATGPVFAQTYGYPGGEIDLIRRGAIPGGLLSGPKARLLLGLALRDGDRDMAAAAFAPYQ